MHSRGSSSSINHPAPLHVSLLHLTVDIDMQLSEAYYFRHVKLKDVFRILAILYVIFQYLFVLLAKSIFSGFAVFLMIIASCALLSWLKMREKTFSCTFPFIIVDDFVTFMPIKVRSDILVYNF